MQTGFAVMEHRVRRNRIPNEHCERRVRAFEDPREKRRNVNSITARKCAAWFRFMQTYIPRCLSGELIEDCYADCISVVMEFFSSLNNIKKRLMFVHPLKSLLFPLN